MHRTTIEEGIEMTQNEHFVTSFARFLSATRRVRSSVRGSGARRHGYHAMGVFAVVAGLLAFGAMPALAAQVRLFTGTFGASASVIANPYPLGAYIGHVAVDDSTHDVYVTDRGNARVEKFDAKGEFLLMFGKAVNKTKVKEVGSTEAEQDLCTAASGDECGVGENRPTPLGEPEFVAVDNSTDESRGDVYVSTWETPTGLVDKFDSSGHLLPTWGVSGQLDGSTVKNPPASIEGPFAEIVGIAVDAAGNLWVQTLNNQTYEFGQEARFITGWKPTGFPHGGDEFSLDSQDNLYTIGFDVLKFDAAGNIIGQIASGGSAATSYQSIVVDPSTNDFYLGIASGSLYSVRRYNSSCHPSLENGALGPPCAPVETFGAGQLHGAHGLAIDPSNPADSLYVTEGENASEPSVVADFAFETVPDVSTVTPSSLTSTSATLEGSVGPSGVVLTECFFEWGETTAYGHKAQCQAPDAAEVPVDSASHAVHAAITGLQVGKTYHYRLAAANANDVNALIDEPSRSNDLSFGPPSIEGQSALNVTATSATLQIQLNPNDIDTDVHIEYGAQAGLYGQITPETDIGSGDAAQNLTVRLQDLLPGILYHYRAFATNSLGVSEGQDETFTTQSLDVFSLPDGRAWELVSPPDKHGALLKFNGVIQAASEGNAITYIASAPTESSAPGNTNQTQVLSTRASTGDSLWDSRDISTPHEVANGYQIGPSAEYKFFSTDLSLSIVQPFGLSSIQAGGGSYLRTDFSSDDPTGPCVSSCYQSLNHSGFASASPDAGHIVLASSSPLTEGAPSTESLYEWTDGQLQLVSVLPDGEASSEGGFVGLKTKFNYGEGVGRNAISVDGSRVVWSTTKSLYLRDMVREETVQLGGANAQFQTASSDDTRVFFSVAGDLYVFEAPAGEALSSGHVTNLTPAGGVLGVVPGASQDGSIVYFVAESAITGTDANEQGEIAVAGQPNLYVESGGVTKLVAVLSIKDEPDWFANSLFLADLRRLTSRVSPDGRWLTFMSDRSLTGYDNRDASSGEADQEVYLYATMANGGHGSLVCASCNPTGARPHGVNFASKVRFLVDGSEVWTGAHQQWIASNVPGWASPAYQDRYLSSSGRLFFNSDDALVPSDTNGTEDVYEYEPPGVGSCTSESVLFSARSGGCVDLVSSGVAREESAFLDASENGDDVFFLTSAQLSPLDTDSVPDVYDARVGGGIPPSSPPPACEGDACQSPVAAPNDQTPGSLTYQGPGNPVPLSTVGNATNKKALKCTKGKKLSHDKCVKAGSKEKTRKARKASRRAEIKGMMRRVGETGRTK